MKKLLIIAVILTSSLSAFAQSRIADRFETRDGRSVIRITVQGNESYSHYRRLRDLEEAVRDLQDQVYELNRAPRVRTETQYVCSVENAMTNRIFTERALTQTEAEAAAINSCRSGGKEFFCGSSKVKCQVTNVEVIY